MKWTESRKQFDKRTFKEEDTWLKLVCFRDVNIVVSYITLTLLLFASFSETHSSRTTSIPNSSSSRESIEFVRRRSRSRQTRHSTQKRYFILLLLLHEQKSRSSEKKFIPSCILLLDPMPGLDYLCLMIINFSFKPTNESPVLTNCDTNVTNTQSIFHVDLHSVCFAAKNKELLTYYFTKPNAHQSNEKNPCEF